MPPNVLIIAPDAVPLPVTDKNRHGTGCGIRAWRMARFLTGRGFGVKLAVPDLNYTPFTGDVGFAVEPYDYYREEKESTPELVSMLQAADIVICQPGKKSASRTVAEATPAAATLILDLWVPNHVEYIPSIQRHGTEEERDRMYRAWSETVMDPLLNRADLFLYGHERQKYYYIGLLCQLGRINPVTYDRRIMIKVPYGLPVDGGGKKSRRKPPTLRPMRDTICPENSFIVLWFSGVYPWFDLATPIRAVELAARKNPAIVLVVKGGVHPLYRKGSSLAVARGKEIADDLGLLGKRIFFDDEWCPQEEKSLWLQDADVAVVAGRDTYESELACRVRSLDFVDHGLPLVNSGGDYIGELLAGHGLASVFSSGDVPGLARILTDLSRDPRLKPRIKRRLAAFKREFAWERCLEPLGSWLDDNVAR
ncbi:hypothetical protein ACFLT7_05875 [candidate division KSB1 bacterium]